MAMVSPSFRRAGQGRRHLAMLRIGRPRRLPTDSSVQSLGEKRAMSFYSPDIVDGERTVLVYVKKNGEQHFRHNASWLTIALSCLLAGLSAKLQPQLSQLHAAD